MITSWYNYVLCATDYRKGYAYSLGIKRYQRCRGRRGCDGMVVGLTTTYSIIVYHH